MTSSTQNTWWARPLAALAVTTALLVGLAIVAIVLDPSMALADRGPGKGSSDGGGNSGKGSKGSKDDGGDDGGHDGGDDGGNSGKGSSNSGKTGERDDDDPENDDNEMEIAEPAEDDDEGALAAGVARATASVASGSASVAGASEAGVDRGGGGGEHLAHEIVVVDDRPDVIEGASALGFTVREQRPLSGLGITITRLRVPAELGVVEAIRQLRATFPGLLVDVNAVYRSQSIAADMAADHPARMVGWNGSVADCGEGRVIGLVDTAVDMAAMPDANLVQQDFIGDGVPADPGHGTGTAALLLGADAVPGLVPGSSLRVASVFQLAEDGTTITTASSIAEALDWLVGSGVNLVNLSLAGSDNVLLNVAVRRAVARGTVLVAAAGNGGPEAPPAYPAAYDGVLAVTAIDSLFNPFPAANRGDYIDLAAPGVDVPTLDGTTPVLRSGTSLAAPFVTALLAAETAAVGLSPDEAVSWLEGEAIDLGAPGRDDVYGWGLAKLNGVCAAE